jgi:CheY-like chemotaxis protein
VLRRIKVKAETRKIPVIILTSTDDSEEIARCYALGCNVYLRKPVAYDAFMKAIRELGLFISVIEMPEIG